MAFDANTDNDRFRSLETRNKTLGDQVDRLTQKCADIREALCAKERSDGSFDIDFDALVEKLGIESALVLRRIIDERYGISGEAGQKPRIRLAAGQA